MTNTLENRVVSLEEFARDTGKDCLETKAENYLFIREGCCYIRFA